MGYGNPGVGGHRQSRGHPRHHLEGHAVLGQQLQFLPAPAKEEGVAALEAHHPLSGQGIFQKDAVDPLLGDDVVAGLLAHVDFFRVFGNQSQNFRPYQPVVDYHLGLRQSLPALLGQKPRIPGASSDQNHIAIMFHGIIPPPVPGPVPRHRHGCR